MRKYLLALLGAISLALGLVACSGPADESTPAATADQTQSEPDETEAEEDSFDPDVVGIDERPVGDSGPQTADILEVDAVYFQAIDMEHGSTALPPASQSDMHFEIDIQTNENARDVGFEAEEFMPYLQIDVQMIEKNTGEVVDIGTLMPMIASDGAHYGNNISLEPGLYTVELTIHSPADDFMLHTGKDSSAVKGRFWTEPLQVTFDNFEWDGQLL